MRRYAFEQGAKVQRIAPALIEFAEVDDDRGIFEKVGRFADLGVQLGRDIGQIRIQNF